MRSLEHPESRPARHASRSARTRRAASGALFALAGLSLAGCEVDAWLGDPSVVGRWERTPTVVPILERIDIIESDSGEFIDVTEVTPEDLLPEPLDYRVSPGDFLRIEIWDIVQPGFPTLYEALVTQRGSIDIPQLGQVFVDGLTSAEVRERLEQIVREKGLVGANPVINVTIPGQRQATFSIFGAIQGSARYGIPYPDYRLLEAVTDAGGISPIIKHVFVIRQIPLSEAMERGAGAAERPTGFDIDLPPPQQQGRPVEDINQLIEELTAPDTPSPGAFSSADAPPSTQREPSIRLAEMQDDDGQAPLIDLPSGEDRASRTPGAGPAAPGSAAAASAPAGQWVFLNGQWMQVMPADRAGEGLPEGPDPLTGGPSADDLVTQRVIRVPVGPLLKGVAKFNIVIRPGDVIHVPGPEQGVVYAMGPGILRAGTYSLPSTGRLTIQRLVAAAGGLSAIAIPERVDLTRVVGENSQATVRLNVRAIFEGTQPDIRLKPDDMVNFGTNFWATPMAVIRNGFRMSYGFGFLLDRNFGNDVFGAPPTRLQGQ